MGISFWNGLVTWAKGKKTYLLAGLLVMVALVLVFVGKLTPQLAFMLLLMALAGFAVTFRLALARHSDQVLQFLTSVAAVGVAARKHDREAELAAAESAALTGAELGAEIEQDKNAAKAAAH